MRQYHEVIAAVSRALLNTSLEHHTELVGKVQELYRAIGEAYGVLYDFPEPPYLYARTELPKDVERLFNEFEGWVKEHT